ncbi:MAG: hypothetical protein J5813_02625 [Candidatus Methanomethylophilaceae archaeon]|nr:hypothetical protein [Candidatus Methanomethylophilaceae archaeon]
MLEARIYVGLRDKDTHEQHYDTERYKEMLKEICLKYRAPFSVQVMEGGYFHQDGTWVDEYSLLITLLGTPRKTVYNIANDVCNMFNQESVIITCTSVLDFTIASGKMSTTDRILMRIRSLFDI